MPFCYQQYTHHCIFVFAECIIHESETATPPALPTAQPTVSPPCLTMDDHHAVTRHLRDLTNPVLIMLGGELGLHYPSMKNMQSPIMGELVAAWLNGEDHVLTTSGLPSWASLIKALKCIDQPGIAHNIEEGKFHFYCGYFKSMVGVSLAARPFYTLKKPKIKIEVGMQ